MNKPVLHREYDMRRDVRTLPLSAGEAEVIALHEHYTARTGFDIALTLDRQRMWREFIGYKTPAFTREDLSLVISYLRAHIARSERNEGALKFLNLIGKVDAFEEDLALARKWRKPGAVQARRTTAAPDVQADERSPEERASSFRSQVTQPGTLNREP